MAPQTRCSQTVSRLLLGHTQMVCDENRPQVSQMMHGSTKGTLPAMHQNGRMSIQPSPSQPSELYYFSERHVTHHTKQKGSVECPPPLKSPLISLVQPTQDLSSGLVRMVSAMMIKETKLTGNQRRPSDGTRTNS